MRLVSLLPLLLSCATPVKFVPQPSLGFHAVEEDGHRFFVYLPADFSTARRWPVIVYLHGGGEAGDDGVLPTQEGLGPVVAASHGTFPFVVAFPQARRGRFWPLADMSERVMRVTARVVRDYAGDPERVYLTGNSMGGFGTWIIGARHPEVFAALVPICGGVGDPSTIELPGDRARPPRGSVAETAHALAHTPVWAFHGASDWMVSVEESRRIVAALRALGAPVRYTEYAGVGHESWLRAYADPALFTWLAEQRRQQ